MSEDKLKAIKSTIKEYLDKRWIKPSTSPYGAPVIVICKKTRELCIVIDYQTLINLTHIVSYLIPSIYKLLNKLGKACMFTKFDLASGYH